MSHELFIQLAYIITISNDWLHLMIPCKHLIMSKILKTKLDIL